MNIKEEDIKQLLREWVVQLKWRRKRQTTKNDPIADRLQTCIDDLTGLLV